eukprot:161795-Pelagomonas_calceolata.AAC.4
MRPKGSRCENSVLSCCPPAAPQPTMSTTPCRTKNQLNNALFGALWNGAAGAEICFNAVNGRFLLRKGWASHGGLQASLLHSIAHFSMEHAVIFMLDGACVSFKTGRDIRLLTA